MTTADRIRAQCELARSSVHDGFESISSGETERGKALLWDCVHALETIEALADDWSAVEQGLSE